MNNSINIRYATLLGLAADARDTCCLSLREVCDGLTERLHSSMAEAQQTRDTLQQQLSSSQPAPVSASHLRAALLLEGDLQVILNRDLDSCSLLQHHTEDNTSLMTDTLQSFMGNIVKSNRSPDPAQSKEPSGSLSFQHDHGAVSSAGAYPKNLYDLCKKVEDLAGQVTSLQTTNTQLCQHLSLLSDANSKLSTEQTTLHKEVTTLKDNNVQLITEQAGLQREVTAMRDKNTIIHQDLAMLTAEKDKVSAELGKLQKDVISIQSDISTQQTDIVQLEADHDDIIEKLNDVQKALQDEANMKKDVDQLKTDCSELKSGIATIQWKLPDLDYLKSEMARIQGRLCEAERVHTCLQRDMTASKNQVGSLQREVQTAQNLLHDNEKAVTTLKSRFATAITQVGFHAELSREVTISFRQPLICDTVVTNLGGWYNKYTGVFTAPVEGTYCFLATTSPGFRGREASLSIVVDGAEMGYVCSEGHSWSTCHTVVLLGAKQKVWLAILGGQKNTFRDRGATSFSGMLLQAKV